MVFAKKETKTPAVIVETKKMSSKDACGMGCCHKMKHLLVPVLLILNTLLLVRVLCQQVSLEAAKVGGRENFEKVQQIYKSDVFKAQQAQQIDQALQQYKQAEQAPTVQGATTTPAAQQAQQAQQVQVAPTATK
ncbi:MAG: hypothetical protein WCH65_09230 [bacterium]